MVLDIQINIAALVAQLLFAALLLGTIAAAPQWARHRPEPRWSVATLRSRERETAICVIVALVAWLLPGLGFALLSAGAGAWGFGLTVRCRVERERRRLAPRVVTTKPVRVSPQDSVILDCGHRLTLAELAARGHICQQRTIRNGDQA